VTVAPLPVGADGSVVNMTRPDDTFGVLPYAGNSLSALSLPLVELSDDESELVSRLSSKVLSKRFNLELRDSYYRGTVRISDLGISIPPSMRNVHTTVGWPRVAVDALDRRLNVDGFLYPDSSDVDADLQEIWLGNDLDAEHSLAHLDALVFGCGFVGVGSPVSGPNVIDTPPLITVESPLDIAVEWDARTRTITAAFRLFGFEGSRQGTLYLPDQTVSLVQTNRGWSVTDRDVHRLGQVLFVRFPNRPRSYDRDGASEITPEIMSLTDAACRTLLGLAVAGEFYSAPQRWILGADEAAFQGPDGTPRSAWETYLGRVLALERDADGNMPTVGQFQAYNPAVYTQVLDSYAQRMSSLTGLPPHVLGFATANPTSADAIRSSEMELTRRADHKTVAFGKGWRDVMRLALLVRGGRIPDDAQRIATFWSSTGTPTIGSTTDAVYKQITMGYLPATSDVVGETLGYTAAQRARIEVDRKLDAGASFLNELAHSVGAKNTRVDRSLATVVADPSTNPLIAADSQSDAVAAK
jgi:SPP1 Gp6-like portal protein